MDCLILSLLMLKSSTIYEIKTAISRDFNTVYSSSLGSIQSALKKLLLQELVTVAVVTDKGVKKKYYSITPQGIAFFSKWIQTPLNWSKAKNSEEGKFFFLGILPKVQRQELLQKLIKNLEDELVVLQQTAHRSDLSKDMVLENSTTLIRDSSNSERNILQISGADTLENTVSDIARFRTYLCHYRIQRLEMDLAFFNEVYRLENQ